MKFFEVAVALICILSANAFRLRTANQRVRRGTSISMGPVLYGSQQTRSPLVNWYLYEKNIPFSEKPPRPSNHPFGQVPFLTDDGGVEVFESGNLNI
jgi:hypothetical protein